MASGGRGLNRLFVIWNYLFEIDRNLWLNESEDMVCKCDFWAQVCFSFIIFCFDVNIFNRLMYLFLPGSTSVSIVGFWFWRVTLLMNLQVHAPQGDRGTTLGIVHWCATRRSLENQWLIHVLSAIQKLYHKVFSDWKWRRCRFVDSCGQQ